MAKADAFVDPYLLWAEARRFRGFAAGKVAEDATRGAWRHLSCVLELDVPALRAEERRRGMKWWTILKEDTETIVTPAFHRIAKRVDGHPVLLAYATVVARTCQILALRGAGNFVRRVVMSLPRAGGPERFDEKNVPAPARGPVPTRCKAGRPASKDRRMRPVMAVIDDRVPILHPQFNDARGRSRLRWFWDQDVGVRWPGDGGATLAPWLEPAGFDYGRELTAKGLSQFIADRRTDGLPTDAQSLYAALCYPGRPGEGRAARGDAPVGAMGIPRSSHGALCASLAAGRDAAGSLSCDAAAGADLIFVQLPSEAMADTSGGGLATYVLDGLRYVLDRSDPNVPLVVNLSFGAAAGPHDGTSVLEMAIEQLLAERRDFALVVPSGNLHFERSDRRAVEQRLHARLNLRPWSRAELRWQVPSGGASDHYLEIWPRGSAVSAHALGVGLLPPATQGANPSSPVEGGLGPVFSGRAAFARKARDGRPTHGIVHCATSPLGLRLDGECAQMALLAVSSPARHPDEADLPQRVQPLRPDGVWRVLLNNEGETDIEIHAWIERSDPTFGGDSRQSHFPVDEPAASEESCLTTVANGPGPLVVGGLVGPAAGATIASYSSAGPSLPPSQRLGPDFSELCEGSIVRPWLEVPAFSPGGWDRANGTSIAAPQVARKVLNRMCNASDRHPQDAAALRAWLLAGSIGRRDSRQGGRLT